MAMAQVPQQQQPVFPLHNLGPVPRLLAVEGVEPDNPVLDRLALEFDLAGDLLAVAGVATAAERAEGDRSQEGSGE
jgi:hypothetical protein